MEKRIYSLCQSMHGAIDELTTERDAEHLRLRCQRHLFFLAFLLDKVATVVMRGLKTWTKLNDAKGIIHSKTVFFSVLRMSKPLSVHSYLK